MAYEAAVRRAFRGRRSMALRACSLRASHPFTPDRRPGGWEIVERGTPPSRR